MTPERWSQISRLYHAALACDERKRAALLAEACSGDEALRREVESLLAQSASTIGPLDEPAVAAASLMVSVDIGEPVLTGRRLGTYHVQERLGAGGMGEVYRAWDTKLRRDVAIKVLPSAFTSDPEWLARFEREARLLASLNHPHIGAIYGLEDADGIRALILELVDGPTLADRLTDGPLVVTEALKIASQIIEALDAAHERGIVHRDLKPANIKVTPDGVVKVLDFGLAKATGVNASGAVVAQSPTVIASSTREGVVLGTAPYMSPEQVRAQPVDRRTDVWAFGCVLFEMLTGRAAFKRDTVADTLAAIVERDPDWNSLPRTLPPTLLRVLKKCLTKDLRHRLRNIADAGLDLEEVLAPAAGDAPSADRSGRVHWRTSTVRWAAAGILLLFAATLVPAVVHFREEASSLEPARFLMDPPRGSTYGFGHLDTRLAISPDGRRLAFVATNSSGVNVLWLRAIDDVSSHQLLGTEGAYSPFWSPDSQVVGFFAGGTLKQVDASGGTPQTVCAAPGAASGAWGRDGTILFSVVSEGEGIRRVSATAGGQPQVVTKMNPSRRETLHFWPSFLPDGRHFLFLALTFVEGRTDHAVFAHDLDTDTTTLVLGASSRVAYVPTGHLLYVREGTLMAQRLDEKALRVVDEPIAVASQVHYFRSTGAANFSASNTGTLVYQTGPVPSQLTWFSRTGRPLETIGTPEYFGGLRLSPDGNRLAIAVNDARSGGADVWVYDLATGLPTSRTTSDPSNDANAVWSPDSNSFAFNSDREGPPDLFVQGVYGGAVPKRILEARGVQYARDWSSDGQFVLYSQVSRTTGADLWALPLAGDRKPFPVAETRFDETAGKFSPDGRWLAFVSDESGRPEVYVEPFPSRDEHLRISNLGGGDPRWRADGTELFYRAADDTLTAVPLNLGTKRIGKPVALFRLPGTVRNDYNHGIYDVSPDGERFLVQSPTEVALTSPFMIVVNWQAGLLTRR